MIRISDLSGVNLERDSADHYKLAASMMSLMCRYGMNRLNFQEVDKFQIGAEFAAKRSLFSHNSSATGRFRDEPVWAGHNA